jgi:ketosteroid isomerase-like protein
MRKIPLLLITLAAAITFAACEPGTNMNKSVSNANTNTNAAKPVAAAPTADALLAMDKAANEAFIKGDGKYFEGMLSDKFTSYDMGRRMSKAEMVGMVGGMKCDVKAWTLDDPQMAMINADTYVLSYKGTFDGTCAEPDGGTMKIPSPVRAASVWVRNGDKWQGVFHGETPIIDPSAPPAPPAKPEMNQMPKKDVGKEADKAAPTAPAATASANTDALVKQHMAGWEAWKAKDAKKFEEMTTANLAIVDPLGMWISGKSAVVKHWTTDMKCEGVNNVKVSDGFSTALSPTVELLTLKGTADGTCDGQKNGGIYQSSIYVKEGDAWKLAFMFEALAAGM